VSSPPDAVPSVLFVCVHNAGRSQMAAGWLRHLAGDAVQVRSAGSLPGDQVNPAAVAAMAEVGIDISDQRPKVLTTGAVEASDVVITMGCGDVCPLFPGKRYLDWQLADPAGKGVESVRPIRDEIEQRIRTLLAELTGPARPTRSPRPSRPQGRTTGVPDTSTEPGRPV
jgi:arsenate reductase